MLLTTEKINYNKKNEKIILKTKQKFILVCHVSGKKHIFDEYIFADMYANMVGYNSYNIFVKCEEDIIREKREKREKLINELLNDN